MPLPATCRRHCGPESSSQDPATAKTCGDSDAKPELCGARDSLLANGVVHYLLSRAVTGPNFKRVDENGDATDRTRKDTESWLRNTESSPATHSAHSPCVYRDPSLYEVIAIANSLPDPDLIRVGQLLLIQGLTREHKVVSGDTQGVLAVRFYGDGMSVHTHRRHIPDPDISGVGQVLRIPDV